MLLLAQTLLEIKKKNWYFSFKFSLLPALIYQHIIPIYLFPPYQLHHAKVMNQLKVLSKTNNLSSFY
jgi:hypothetical protein